MLTAEPPAGTPRDCSVDFSKLAMRHRGPLLAYCGRLVGADHAEDVLQQTLLKAWLALEERRVDVENPRAWLYRIAHNQAMDHLRKAGVPWDELDCEWESPESTERSYEAQERLGRVSAGIRELPVRQREALLMHSFRGDSYADIAVKMETNVPVVSQLIMRARSRLREIPALVPGWFVVRRLAGAARRATTSLSGTTKAAVVVAAVATGAGLPLAAEHAGRHAPDAEGTPAVGALAPQSFTQPHSATPRHAVRSRAASAHAVAKARSGVTSREGATTPATVQDPSSPAQQKPGTPDAASHGHGGGTASGRSAPTVPPVNGSVSVSTSVPGVATVHLTSGVLTSSTAVRLPSAGVPAAVPSLSGLPRG